MKALKGDKNRQKIEGSQHLEERKEIKWIFHFFLWLFTEGMGPVSYKVAKAQKLFIHADALEGPKIENLPQ